MYALVRPLLFGLDPARAHALAMAALAPAEHLAPVRALLRTASDPRLAVKKMGLEFPNPVGLAAGFDKNAERARALAALGFGHVELGTVTAEPQGPNPPPNMFRLPADRALVNRLGFPNAGAEVVAKRIAARKAGIRLPVGVSIGKSRSVPASKEALGDYLTSFRAVRSVADFVVVNVSSPNTKDLRALQAADIAKELFDALMAEKSGLPILVKIAPDLSDADVDAICDAAGNAGLAGVVATNTTISREGLATAPSEIERIGAGGLSGEPLFPRALSVVKRARTRLGSQACVIGVGGVRGGETALAMLRAGADLVQAYTGFVYEGPFLAQMICRELLAEMDRSEVQTLTDLVKTTSPSRLNGESVLHRAP